MAAFNIETYLPADRFLRQNIDTGTILFSLGDACEHFVYVQNGSIRVELLSVSGQQLLLYRLGAGQSCVITTACLLGRNAYTAQAITETPVELVLIPHSDFQTYIEDKPAFRDFVFQGFAERLAIVMQRVGELSTQTVDQRLVAALLAHASNRDGLAAVTLTHEQLAIEIGSAREVVSRRLAALEKSGLLVRRRGVIELLNLDGLSERLSA